MKNISKKTIIAAGSIVVMSLLMASSGLAAAGSSEWEKVKRGVAAVGVVSSVSGSNITISGRNGKIYIVDASRASITAEDGSLIQLSDIQDGDTLAVQGKAAALDPEPRLI